MLADAAEAAALQGRFWEMHDSLLEDQAHLDDPHLWERCEHLGIDLDRFEADRRSEAVAERVSAISSGIRGGDQHAGLLLGGPGGLLRGEPPG